MIIGALAERCWSTNGHDTPFERCVAGAGTISLPAFFARLRMPLVALLLPTLALKATSPLQKDLRGFFRSG